MELNEIIQFSSKLGIKILLTQGVRIDICIVWAQLHNEHKNRDLCHLPPPDLVLCALWAVGKKYKFSTTKSDISFLSTGNSERNSQSSPALQNSYQVLTNCWTDISSPSEPVVRVLGGPDLFVNAGSFINLTCTGENLPGTPCDVHWYHQDQVCHFDESGNLI